jgi:dolichol kinase
MGLEILTVAVWFAFLLLQQRLLDVAIRTQWITPFTARKISHVNVGLWVIPLAAFVRRWCLAAIPITMILAANARANARRGSLGRVQERFFPLVGFVLPEILILYLWQQHSNVVVLAVLAMTVGDTAAAYAGMYFGTYGIPWTAKTIEGATANFLTTLAVLAAAGHMLYGMPVSLFPLPAAAAAVLEAVTPGEWDNPLTIVILLVLLSYPLR